MSDIIPAPWRIAFDNARDPYTARNALGITTLGGGGSGAPDDAQYITAATDAALTAERVLTNTATITWDFTTPGQAKASTAAGGGNVSNSGTPTLGQYAKWVTATTIQGVSAATVLGDIGAAPLASPTFTGDPKAPTPATADNDTSIATTAYVQAQGYLTTAGAAAAYQPLDADLTALAALTGTNTIYFRSAANVWSPVVVSTGLAFSGGNLTSTVTSGAPVGAEYITSTSDATLTSERVLTDTATVTWDRTTAGQIKANAAGGGTSTTISDTPPGSPTAGSLWWESDTGTLWIYYTDANTSQWVMAAGGSNVVQPGALVQIQRQDVSSAVAQVDFTSGIDGTYDEYEIHVFGFRPSVNAFLSLRFSQDGGATFKAGASDYAYAYTGMLSTNSVANAGGVGTNLIWLGVNDVWAGGTGDYVGNYRIILYRPSSTTTRKHVTWTGSGNGSSAFWSGNGSGNYVPDLNAVNAIRFLTSTVGNITAGSFILYGVKK
jgi:hypothetical protein